MQSIQIEIENYKKELREIKKELKTIPDGCLIRRGSLYCHRLNGKEKGITRNQDLIRKLCRKKYLLIRQKRLKKNLIAATGFLKKYESTSPEEMIADLSSTYKRVPSSFFFRPPADGWAAQSYKKSAYNEEALTYFSNNGIRVRSKSEALIANLLESYHIPFRYEAAITLGLQTKYPDFTIQRTSDEAIILWEHFGALHLPGYVTKMNEKLEWYVNHGFVPFETLICTFELDIRSGRRIHDFIESIVLS